MLTNHFVLLYTTGFKLICISELWTRSGEIFICRTAAFRLSSKIGVLKIFAILTGTHLCWSLLYVFAGISSWNVIKDTPTQVFSCEYCKIFKNNLRYLLVLWKKNDGFLLLSLITNSSLLLLGSFRCSVE